MQPKKGPAKPTKSAEARGREAEMIRIQLQDLGFPEEAMHCIQQDLATFVARGESWTRTYKFRELGVEVLLQLSMQPHVTSFARVRRTAR